MSVESDLLPQLEPTPGEEAAMQARVDALLDACRAVMADQGLAGEPTVQGSVAKGTWLSGSADVDCFILMDPETPQEVLKTVSETVGHAVLSNPRVKYAQHPYVIGEFDGADVDLVPAYKVAHASSKMSAVDRTPFHTEWVRSHLDEAARGDVRLLKQWCKGVEIYGAETAQGGFSGYLLEVLIHRLGGFTGVLNWFAANCQPARVPGPVDEVDDDVSPLVVSDPVDPARNCAAAVQAHIIQAAADAAQAYATSPAREFFHPPPPNAEEVGILEASMASNESVWLSVETKPLTDRLDIVFSQFQKAARTVAAELERAGFPVLRHRVDAWDEDAAVGMQWMVKNIQLPAEKIHDGPRADRQPNADGFRAKWQDHPDAVGGITVQDGHLQVRVAVRHRTPDEWLQANLANMAFGKHVTAAFGTKPHVSTRPGTAATSWAPRVADFILDRRPWQRPAA